MALKLAPITQAQWLVNLNGTDFYFSQFSGLVESRSPSDYADPQTNRIHHLTGPATLSEMTLTVPFDPDFHAGLVDLWQSYACELRTFTITPVDCSPDPETLGRTITMLDCHLTGLEFASVDKSSGETSNLILKFTCDSWQYV